MEYVETSDASSKSPQIQSGSVSFQSDRYENADLLAANRPGLRSKALSEFETKLIIWLWKDRIPYGCVTLVEGDGGIGKSFVLASVASAVSSGVALPEDVAKPARAVLLLAAEDDPSVVLRPRFERHGANLEIVRCYDQSMLLNEQGLAMLEREIQKFDVGLLIIDPIVSFLGQKIDTSKATDVRSFMQPLHEMAKRLGCAVVVVRHWTKNTQAAAAQRGSGSVDFRNAARSVLQVIKMNDKRYLTLEKSNYGVDGQTLEFEIEDQKIKWTGKVNLKADEILSQALPAGCDRGDVAEAVHFLETELAEGPMQSKVIEGLARELGISHSTLKRAKKKLGVRAFKMPGCNEWKCEIKFSSFDSPSDDLDAIDQGQFERSGSSLPAQELDPHPPLFNCNET